jgi:hypothetical protein
VKDAFCLLDEFEAGLRAHFEAAHATLERQARTDGAEGKPVLDGESRCHFAREWRQRRHQAPGLIQAEASRRSSGTPTSMGIRW